MAENTKTKTPAKSAANPAPSMAAKTSTAKTGTAKTPAKKPRAKKISGPTVAVFIDIENTNVSHDNLLEIFTNLKTKATITYGKLYGYRFEKAADYDEIVAEHRLETVGRMRFKHGEDSVVDTRLVVDCIVAAESGKYDSIFVWAGVGDLMSLFAHIKQHGARVITVDLPIFDCSNKFVDQKLKLFSPHTLKKPTPVAAVSAAPPIKDIAAAASAKPDAPLLDALIAGKTIPTLPRKDGAPEIAKNEISNSFGAIADGEKELEDFDESELEDLEEIEDDEIIDDEEDDETDFDDFDDLGDDMEDLDEILDDINIDTGAEVFDADENDKLMELSQELIKSTKKGKDFDAKSAAKSLRGNKRASRNRDEFSDLGNLEDGNSNKHAYYSAATQYDADSSGEAPDDKVKSEDKEKDEFNDFGNL